MHNFQRDGMLRMDVTKGRVAYEPNSLAADGPREIPAAGFTTFPEDDAGGKVRERSETFADHYSQPSLFWRSMTEPEQRHIVSAFTFELSKVETLAVRRRMLGHLDQHRSRARHAASRRASAWKGRPRRSSRRGRSWT